MRYLLLDETDIYQLGDESLYIESVSFDRIWVPIPKWAIGKSGKLITVRRPIPEECPICRKTGGSHDLNCIHPSCVNT